MPDAELEQIRAALIGKTITGVDLRWVALGDLREVTLHLGDEVHTFSIEAYSDGDGVAYLMQGWDA